MPKAQKRRTAAQKLRDNPILKEKHLTPVTPVTPVTHALLIAHGCSCDKLLDAAIRGEYPLLFSNDLFLPFLENFILYPVSDENICVPSASNVSARYPLTKSSLSTIPVNLMDVLLRANSKRNRDLVKVARQYLQAEFKKHSDDTIFKVFNPKSWFPRTKWDSAGMYDKYYEFEYLPHDLATQAFGLILIDPDTKFPGLNKKTMQFVTEDADADSQDIASFSRSPRGTKNLMCLSNSKTPFICAVSGFEELFEMLMAKLMSKIMKLSDIIALLFLLYPHKVFYFLIYACAGPCERGICQYSQETHVASSAPPPSIFARRDVFDVDKDGNYVFGGGKSRKNRNRNKNKNRKSKTRKSKHR